MGSGRQRVPRPSRSRALSLPGEGAEACAGESSHRRRCRRQGIRMAVGSVKMQPPCESPALASAAPADGPLRRSPSARESEREPPAASLRPRLRDLPALLRSGLTLRRKRNAAGARVSGPGAHVEPAGPRRRALEVGEMAGLHWRGPGRARLGGALRSCAGHPSPQLHLTEPNGTGHHRKKGCLLFLRGSCRCPLTESISPVHQQVSGPQRVPFAGGW